MMMMIKKTYYYYYYYGLFVVVVVILLVSLGRQSIEGKEKQIHTSASLQLYTNTEKVMKFNSGRLSRVETQKLQM